MFYSTAADRRSQFVYTIYLYTYDDFDGSLIVRYAEDDEKNGGKQRSEANVDAEGKHDNHHSGTGYKGKVLLLVKLGHMPVIAY